MRYSFLIIAITVLSETYSFAQVTMSPKEAFYYSLQVNNIDINNSLHYEGLGNSGGSYQWIDFYASYFDKVNYLKSVNDEFKKVPYLTKIYNEMDAGISNINFNKTFYVQAKQTVGTYDAQCGCFPLNRYKFSTGITFRLLDIKQVGNNTLLFGNSFLSFNIGKFFNLNDFDFVLKMKMAEAEKFINSRKDNNGNINRDVTIKVIYNVVNKPFQNNKHDYYIGAYIHKLEFYNGSTLLATSFPKYNYYDKVNLIKLKDGVDTVYYGKDNNPLTHNNLSLASYYRITTYTNGKATGPLEDYYLNGAKKMAGYIYNSVWNGQFTWFYDNGQKFSETAYAQGNINGIYSSWYSNGQKNTQINYINDKKDGLYVEWYSNGQKKEEVKYKNDKKEGCDYNWDENGKCKTLAWGNNSEFYENGIASIGSSKCPCSNSRNGNISQSSNSSANSQQTISHEKTDYIGYYNSNFSSGEYKFVDAGLYYKSNSAQVKSVIFDVNGVTPDFQNSGLIFKGSQSKNQILTATITFNGFKNVNGSYKYASSFSNMYGKEVYDKKENMITDSQSEPLIEKIVYNPPSLKAGAKNSHTFYMNFLIKDLYSDAIIQGFFKFTLLP